VEKKKMLTIDEIRVALIDRNLRAVSRKTGLAYETVVGIAKGSDNVHYRTVQKLSEYVQGLGRQEVEQG
jgi:hypothetical protein